jgi:nitroreductase
MAQPKFMPYGTYREYPAGEMRQRAEAFRDDMRRRRTVRQFSDRPVDRSIIEACIAAAGTAPSGANMQPWHFVLVGDPEIKHKIRIAAEQEEREFYTGRAPQEWLDALESLGTDEHKPFLETAPYLVAIFVQKYSTAPDGSRIKHYYPVESVGIATGILITGLHWAGLATLTHTPSPMGFLNEILGCPNHERPFLLLVTGYPAEDAQVPVIGKKTLAEILTLK